jgi:hypothetical protein
MTLKTSFPIIVTLALGIFIGAGWENYQASVIAEAAQEDATIHAEVADKMAHLCGNAIRGLAWEKTPEELKAIIDNWSGPHACDPLVLYREAHVPDTGLHAYKPYIPS